ncbi:hypothetical protein KR222_000015, partial [Zaprionus bogoriensis]
YPNEEESCLGIRRVWYLIFLLQCELFFVTLLLALPESMDNIADFGQDLLWICGSFYIFFKWHYFYFFADEADEIIDELDQLFCESKCGPAEHAIRMEQRHSFLLESFLCLAWHFFIFVFIVLTISQPAWTTQALPFHAWFPFEWHNPAKHPIAHLMLYFWQSYFTVYNMVCIIYIDLFSAHSFLQLASNLKILCLEFQALAQSSDVEDARKFRFELGRLIAGHQRMIALVERTNVVFYAPLLMQLFAAFQTISLSTLSALVARHEPFIALRFIVFMILSFVHLAYWCVSGDVVTQQSQQVAFEAYELYAGSPGIPELQRDIKLIMQRAQEPLCMGPSPFPPFNLLSNMAIVKQCYSILTFLLEYLD